MSENYNKEHIKCIFKTAISILVISNHNSFWVLFDKTASLYFFDKYIYIFALEIASPGNQHCANCISTLLVPIEWRKDKHYDTMRYVTLACSQSPQFLPHADKKNMRVMKLKSLRRSSSDHSITLPAAELGQIARQYLPPAPELQQNVSSVVSACCCGCWSTGQTDRQTDCHRVTPVFEKTCATTQKNVKVMFFLNLKKT